MLIYNTGKHTSDTMFATNRVQGCNGDIRYHNQRADFSVDSATRARIVIENGKRATVHIDWHDTNEWHECASLDLSEMYDSWLKEAHIGITAATGQLADNHDASRGSFVLDRI